jgi:hypothetical protein
MWGHQTIGPVGFQQSFQLYLPVFRSNSVAALQIDFKLTHPLLDLACHRESFVKFFPQAGCVGLNLAPLFEL